MAVIVLDHRIAMHFSIESPSKSYVRRFTKALFTNRSVAVFSKMQCLNETLHCSAIIELQCHEKLSGKLCYWK